MRKIISVLVALVCLSFFAHPASAGEQWTAIVIWGNQESGEVKVERFSYDYDKLGGVVDHNNIDRCIATPKGSLILALCTQPTFTCYAVARGKTDRGIWSIVCKSESTAGGKSRETAIATAKDEAFKAVAKSFPEADAKVKIEVLPEILWDDNVGPPKSKGGGRPAR